MLEIKDSKTINIYSSNISMGRKVSGERNSYRSRADNNNSEQRRHIMFIDSCYCSIERVQLLTPPNSLGRRIKEKCRMTMSFKCHSKILISWLSYVIKTQDTWVQLISDTDKKNHKVLFSCTQKFIEIIERKKSAITQRPRSKSRLQVNRFRDVFRHKKIFLIADANISKLNEIDHRIDYILSRKWSHSSFVMVERGSRGTTRYHNVWVRSFAHKTIKHNNTVSRFSSTLKFPQIKLQNEYFNVDCMFTFDECEVKLETAFENFYFVLGWAINPLTYLKAFRWVDKLRPERQPKLQKSFATVAAVHIS